MILLTPNGDDDIYIHAWSVGMASEGKHALQLAEEGHCSELGIPVFGHPLPLFALSTVCLVPAMTKV